VVPVGYAATRDRRRECLLDLLLVGCLLAFGQAEVWNSGAELLVGPAWLNAVVFAVMSLALLWRRSHPLLVLAAQCGVLAVAVVAVGGTSQSLGWLLPLIAGVYAVAAAPGPVRLLPAASLVIGLIVVLGAVDLIHGRNAPWTDYLAELGFLGLVALGWLLGSLVRARRLYAEEAIRTAELRARAAEEHTLRTAAEQRNRIAHELHDCSRTGWRYRCARPRPGSPGSTATRTGHVPRLRPSRPRGGIRWTTYGGCSPCSVSPTLSRSHRLPVWRTCGP